MQRIEATYRIVTPMFLGDADQKATSIRPPSVKGALRFWWRALNWSRALSETGSNAAAALRWLHAEEARLFGLAAITDSDGNQQGGQGVFLLRVIPVIKPVSTLPKADPGHQYLLGQGLYHFKNGYLRSGLTDGEFKVQVLVNPRRVRPDDIQSMVLAMKAFGLLGGLGSRSRKGIGSVMLKALPQVVVSMTSNRPISEQTTVPATLDDLEASINALIPASLAGSEPPFSAFSTLTRVVMLHSAKSAWSALNDFGEEMMRYRSWGQNGMVLGQTAERNFKDDHDIAFAISSKKPDFQHPRRVIFGLPHNYFFSSTNYKAEMTPVHQTPKGAWETDGRGRRAAPLFVHVHDIPAGGSVIIVTLLRSTFLPVTDHIEMSTKGFRHHVEAVPDWSVLDQFLDRFAQRREWQR